MNSIFIRMLLALVASSVGEALAIDGLSATTSQRVHPVLIKKPQNAFLKVAVEVTRAEAVQLTGLEFSLAGVDELEDIESLQVFSSGEKGEFSATAPLGEVLAPADRVTAKLNQPLKSGMNVFWLACRLKATADLAHRVDAACVAVETSAGKVVPEDKTPGISHRIGIALRQHNDDGVHTYRIPALTTSAKGTLMCVYDMRRRAARDLQEDIDIGLVRSLDGGKTWETQQVIMDMGKVNGLGEEQNGCSDPGIIVDHQTGEIFVFAVWMWGKPGKHQWQGDGSEPGYEIGKTAQLLVVKSKDDGLTWSKPENLTRILKPEPWWLLAPAPQQGFQLADGTLVMPVQGRHDKGEKFSTIMSSRDHGATWTVGAPAYFGSSECQAAPLSDGSIMLNMRNDREKFRAVSVTKDFGKTWEAHATNRNTLIEPTCNGSLLRANVQLDGQPSSVLLFANPHSQKARDHQSIQVSFDDGKTWPATHRVLLDEGKGRGYPSLTQIDEQHIGIVYEGGECDVMFERLSIPGDLIQPEQQALGDKVCIALIGDSTVSSYPKPPADRPSLAGWGQVFGEFFKDTVTVKNHAASGRSSKSFRTEKRWAPVLKEKPDFVFIQFGHNDQPGKGPERETDPQGSYQRGLRRYIREAREAGIRPVLVTPVARRIFSAGKPVSTLTPYAEAMQEVGKQTDTPVIDLHGASFALYGRLGDEGSSDFSPSESDRTHFSRKGAIEIARLVADAVQRQLSVLQVHSK